MTPEQRLDRAERILVMMANAGRRAREHSRKESREQNEKINIIIQTQLEIEEIMKRSAARHDKEMAELRESQKLTDESVRATERAVQAFIDSLRKGRNGSSFE